MKLLLVEDNDMNRDMLARRLSRKGFQIIQAENGRQALEVAAQHLPDLILMDLSLPEMDGWEASAHLKAQASTRHIPIIALTAHAMVGDREKALEVGCDDYDTKPVEFKRLLEKIHTWLAKEVV